LAQPPDSSQRARDEAVSNQSFKALLVTQSEPYHRAMLLAAFAALQWRLDIGNAHLYMRTTLD